MLAARTEHLIDLALEEDTGLGDITSRAIFPAAHRSRAVIDAKQDLVVCGLEIAARVFAQTDPKITVRLLARDGDRVKKGAIVLRLEGPTERVGAALVIGREDGPRTDGVHPDPVRRVIHRHPTRQPGHGGLGGVVLRRLARGRHRPD